MKLTFIIPVFNRAEKLQRCLRSLRESDLSECEVIVVDDASTDETAQVKSGGEIDKVVRLPVNLGVTGAKNAGIDHASGDVLVFLDSDDMLKNGGTTLIRQLFAQHPEADIMFAACENLHGVRMHSSDMRFGEWDYRDFLISKHPGEFLPLCRARVFQHLRYETDLRGFEGITWLAAAKVGNKIVFTNKVVRVYDNIGVDRLCCPQNLVKDYRRLARGFVYEIRQYGADTYSVSLARFAVLAAKACIYSRCAGSAWSEVRTPEGAQLGARAVLYFLRLVVWLVPTMVWGATLKNARGL